MVINLQTLTYFVTSPIIYIVGKTKKGMILMKDLTMEELINIEKEVLSQRVFDCTAERLIFDLFIETNKQLTIAHSSTIPKTKIISDAIQKDRRTAYRILNYLNSFQFSKIDCATLLKINMQCRGILAEYSY